MAEPKHIDLSARDFINKTCVLYGASGTGKTTIIKHVLWLCRKDIPTTIVFSQSDKDNHTYSRNLVPRNLVYDNPTPEILGTLAKRQRNARALYDKVNQISVLRALAARFADAKEMSVMEEFDRVGQSLGPKPEEEMFDMYKDRYCNALKSIVGAHIEQLEQIKRDLSETELFTLQWRNFNPKIMLIFDDCTSAWATLKNKPEACELIYRGRHMLCSTIIAVHGDGALTPILRQNIRVSFFTDQTSATQFVKRATNALSKQRAMEFTRAIKEIVDDQPPYTKLMYVRGVSSIIVAQAHETFSAVWPSIRRFCDAITKKESEDQLEPWMKGLLAATSSSMSGSSSMSTSKHNSDDGSDDDEP